MSIRRYLVLTLFSVLTLITFIAAIQGYKQSMSQAEAGFDQQLLSLAQTLTAMNSMPNANINRDKTLQVVQQSAFAFQVWKNKRLILKSNNAPDHLITNIALSSHQGTEFFEVNFLDQRWRAVALSSLFLAPNDNMVVIVAQPLKAQFSLTQTLILAAVTPMIVAIAVLSLLIFIIITQGLKPLHKLSFELSRRKSNDFSPLNVEVDNNELADIVATLNELFARLDAAFQRERHFASDAAHELKTPLSVLKIDTHNLIQDLAERSISNRNQQLTSTDIENFSSIHALNNSVDRMGHVIDQILNLNRTNPAQISNVSSAFNINVLLKQVIAELYNDILHKDQVITLESDDIFLSAHEFSVHLLATNLISNANKYTPIEGEILISVTQGRNKTIALCVEDSGQGIDETEYQRVFDRFYRVGGDQHDSDIFGCGLGLAIVKHIADLHGANIQLSRSTLLKGLKVEVIFPATANEEIDTHG
ncbi:ATP-binding protein [Colwellia sp. 1_MG-2023]|uniref:ATP-binding protein n=1 Tax=unclassified Colwellia TaxID=196834 RepID=UPI001C0947EF|nr:MULTISPECIES: ATP-binding protein [unclassified Colwellia]MBU2923388.1 sensor histidine kinase N-terminal domain-containing protein [Colwellia sp. C2M11]MDO6653748.1 ATP-binding protein [Colwellia sp. 3_MG-2023]MDO6666622.1 ATP-binding protein [Colwellia sp. 2_MG-2023]MDO6691065.1 ATP-binding protein [Colwellia sp. 1_MG-2023]